MRFLFSLFILSASGEAAFAPLEHPHGQPGELVVAFLVVGGPAEEEKMVIECFVPD